MFFSTDFRPFPQSSAEFYHSVWKSVEKRGNIVPILLRKKKEVLRNSTEIFGRAQCSTARTWQLILARKLVKLVALNFKWKVHVCWNKHIYYWKLSSSPMAWSCKIKIDNKYTLFSTKGHNYAHIYISFINYKYMLISFLYQYFIAYIYLFWSL